MAKTASAESHRRPIKVCDARREEGASKWKPPPLQAIHGGYITTRHDYALAEGCRRLDVTMVESKPGSSRRAAHALVSRDDGSQCWLKVTGLYQQAENASRRAEIEVETAVIEVPKPQVFRRVEWEDEDVYWRATLMTLAASPAVSARAWCYPTTVAISDSWLDELCGALRSLRFARCEGTFGSPADLRNAIATYVGVEIATDGADWHASHGDLQWSNVTAPRLMVLDWECYCRAPQSYDPGRLLAFSVLDQALTRRLLARFAEDFQTSSGQVGLWSALAMVRYQIAHGQVDPSLDEPLRGLIQQLRSQFR